MAFSTIELFNISFTPSGFWLHSRFFCYKYFIPSGLARKTEIAGNPAGVLCF
jgi:hypothetical protein